MLTMVGRIGVSWRQVRRDCVRCVFSTREECVFCVPYLSWYVAETYHTHDAPTLVGCVVYPNKCVSGISSQTVFPLEKTHSIARCEALNIPTLSQQLSNPPPAPTPTACSIFLQQLRKLGVLLDMEDSVEGLLDRAADAEALRDSLADVDLSAPEDDDDDDWEEEDDEQEARDRDSSAVSALVSPRAGSAPQVVKAMPILRNTSWDKDAVGNDDTTEVRRAVVVF